MANLPGRQRFRVYLSIGKIHSQCQPNASPRCRMAYKVVKSLSTLLQRHFSAGGELPKAQNLPKLSKIPTKYKCKSVHEAQKALVDYLHTTRSLPFVFAEHIAKNSPFTLFKLISNVEFSVTNFSKSFRKFLRYHPINEFEVFFESIGIVYNDVGRFLPTNKFFFSEDGSALNAACALSGLGFPWNKLGKLYVEERSIFSKNLAEITTKFSQLKHCGFNSVSAIGMCLAFPCILSKDCEALLDDLKTIFQDLSLAGSAEESVDSYHEICKKIRLFYNLGFEKGNLGELMGGGSNLVLQFPEDVILHKIEYFSRFDVEKGKVGRMIITNPEILNVDLEAPVISVLELLKHFGLEKEKLNDVVHKFPFVLGRNKLANLPHILRALDLNKWFFNEIQSRDSKSLVSYRLSYPNEGLDKEYNDALNKISLTRTSIHTMQKLSFLHETGFGENGWTVKILAHLHGTRSELAERFNCLLGIGIEYSKLCLMLSSTPKILNQKPETLEQKVKFLSHEMRSSIQYLDSFPAFLCFDLEKRIKPRFRFHMWLVEKGLCTRNYSIGSLIATSEKKFLGRLFGIHPATLKLWFECFSYKKPQQ